MFKLFCRVFQLIMKVGNYALPYRMPEYIEGPGSSNELVKVVKKGNYERVLVVTDNGLMKLGLLNNMLKEMENENLSYVVHSDIHPNPTSDDVEAGVKTYLENKCQAIIAFGGGAPMDTAKAIGARIARPNKSIAQLQGLMTVLKKIPPLYAVPTTAGTGSETTIAALITDTKTNHKASILDTVLIPKFAVLDPTLTVGLPPHVTSTTGMDALCHAVEAYTNYTYCTALEKDLAKKAVKLIYDNLLVAYQDGSNLEARQNMQKAAFFAGRAFTRGSVGYVHAIGHTLGGLYHLPHGNAMAAILPVVMRKFGTSVDLRLAELADVCGIQGKDNHEKATKFIEWIESLQRDMNIQTKFDIIKEEDIPQIIKWANKESNPLYPVPTIWGEAEFRDVINQLRA